MGLRRYTLTLVRRAAVTAALFALPMASVVLARAGAMDLKIGDNQIILSGPVVGDEPGKVREALANSPGIDTVILRLSFWGSLKCAQLSVAQRNLSVDLLIYRRLERSGRFFDDCDSVMARVGRSVREHGVVARADDARRSL
jgi:hypothetical protein